MIGAEVNAMQAKVLTPQMRQKRRDFLCSLGKWSHVVMLGVLGGGMITTDPARAVNWNDCRADGPWLNSSGSGGHWVNNADSGTRLQGGDSGDQPRDGQARRPWLNGNRDGWTNRQGCAGGTWVNF